MNFDPVFQNSNPVSSTGYFLFSGGGTGGHLFPGLAVAEQLRQYFSEQNFSGQNLLDPIDPKIVFVGSQRSIEQKILKSTSFPHEQLEFESPRKLLKNPVSFWKNWQNAKRQARLIFKKYPPSMVVGLGGFASYPILKQAVRDQIPVFLLEQNAVPGRVTSLFSRRAEAIFTSYEETRRYFSRQAKTICTGNPLRAGVCQLRSSKQVSADKPTFLICGGSQGSKIINQAIVQFLKTQPEVLKKWKIRHQTGENEATERLKEIYLQQGIEAQVSEFFDSPEELYTGVELVLGRAGGTTLAELDWLEIPAILIPISNSVRNHQQLNAEAHLKKNQGTLLKETEIVSNHQNLLESSLTTWLSRILETRQSSFKNFEEHPLASQLILEHLLGLRV